jgi:catechol 2,3-dioxygenase-like lactoylglutathione lyase family enzyme
VFDHVTIRVSDRAASERFYETGLRVLGTEPTYRGDDFAEPAALRLASAESLDYRPAAVRVLRRALRSLS